MNDGAIVFALANPDPEVDPFAAAQHRLDELGRATGAPFGRDGRGACGLLVGVDQGDDIGSPVGEAVRDV